MPFIHSRTICSRCRRSFIGSGSLCPACRPNDTRAPAFKRGYDHSWRKIRAEVLTEYGIPKELWSQYDVDHNPPYNQAVESDHRKYQLIPRLHAEHSRKTAVMDTPRDKQGNFTSKRGQK